VVGEWRSIGPSSYQKPVRASFSSPSNVYVTVVKILPCIPAMLRPRGHSHLSVGIHTIDVLQKSSRILQQGFQPRKEIVLQGVEARFGVSDLEDLRIFFFEAQVVNVNPLCRHGSPTYLG
jgi:hypothetical protein